MKILITGSKGFVGTETCKLLEEKGHDIIHFDIMDGFDIRNMPQLLDAAIDVDRILHLAAIARFDESDRDPVLAFETNVEGSRNVAEVAKEYNIPLVHASTGSVYMPIVGEPPITEDFPIRGNSVYACTKCAGEIYARRHNPHIILRYAHLYGSEKRNAGLIGNFFTRIQRGLNPMVYGGDQSTEFCYIKDVAEANVKALEAPWPAWNDTYNIGSGEEISAFLATEILADVFDYEGDIEFTEARIVDTKRFIYDTSKAEIKLRFKAKYDFRKGLKDMKGKLC